MKRFLRDCVVLALTAAIILLRLRDYAAGAAYYDSLRGK